MYRHNKLYEELDKLRSENDFLKWQNSHLRELMAQKDLQIRNLQLQLQVKDMSIHLLSSTKPQPMVIKVDDDAMPPEPFKTGLDTGILKDKQVHTATEIVNDEKLMKEFCQNLWQIPDNIIDEVLNELSHLNDKKVRNNMDFEDIFKIKDVYYTTIDNFNRSKGKGE